MQGCTYDAEIFIDILEKNMITNEEQLIENIMIVCIPMMVYPDDDGSDGIGGYFIINNIERVLVSQIRQTYNQVLVSFPKDSKKNRIKNEGVKFKSTENDEIAVVVEIRSISEASNHSCGTLMYLTRQDQIMMKNTKFQGKLSVALILKGLGCTTREDFLWVAFKNKNVARILETLAMVALDQETALSMLAEKFDFSQKSIEKHKLDRKEVLQFLTSELFPHLGLRATPSQVALFIGYLIKKLFCAKETKKGDDRDSLVFKRFEPAGILINDLFEQHVKQWISQLSEFCKKKTAECCNS
jgi:DNA-directed RNA polymerase beta subunit